MELYESEHTKFMREWLAQHPDQIEESIQGRALWWDKANRDMATQRRDQQANVAQKPYYYDIN